MKKIIFVIGFLSLFGNGYSQWVQKSSGIGNNKTIWSIAVLGNKVFAGTYYGIYVSTDNGDNWTVTQINNISGNVLYVSGSNLYAGTNQGIYLSTNEGVNWTQTGLTTGYVWAITKKDTYIFAGTSGNGLYVSSNNGANWFKPSNTPVFVSSLTVNGNYVFAGDWANPYVYVSSDNGSNWTLVPTGGTEVSVILALTVKDNIIFAGADNTGIYQSSNNGLSWSKNSLEVGGITCFTVKDNYIFAGDFLFCKLYMTTNNGSSWLLKSQGLGSQLSVWSIGINNSYVFAGTDSSVWRRPYSEVIRVNSISTVVPSKFSLSQSYPNPFNPSTNIRYTIPSNVKGKMSNVKLVVFDILGKEIATLVNEKQNAGTYEAIFDGSGLTSGFYFYRLTCGDFSETRKMVLIK
jgi:hypothetical protein